MADPTTTALAELARAIGVKPRYTKEERAAIAAARQQRAEHGTRTARAKRNRDLGIPQPVAGTQLLVRSIATEKRHRRCGIDFGPSAPISLTVSTYSRAKCEELRNVGEPVVSEDEAEHLLADTLLITIPIARGLKEPAGNDEWQQREKALAARESAAARELEEREKELARREALLADKEKKLANASTIDRTEGQGAGHSDSAFNHGTNPPASKETDKAKADEKPAKDEPKGKTKG